MTNVPGMPFLQGTNWLVEGRTDRGGGTQVDGKKKILGID